ncbi:putative TetR family transcriptional regulator [Caenibius tardaugens NBRC 16725]|uniref:Putative TetR family transcriptional regulator n=1 Tax=Caenibius tardaugens NBRC 16725 TaxID=1219035 RepID=U3A0L7_9SPHN|nr:TetR/AcrR family transcriptional regulator [Caenibius tardaugens]GAD51194.1 putative TetR family transcriptional regulator [Caenibius tardaugens NBRC 16725]
MSLLKNRKVRTEEQILNAAERIFRDCGFDNARMSDIAEQAEIAPKTLFNYFHSKERLVLALIMRWLEKNYLHFKENEKRHVDETDDILPENAELRLEILDKERWLSTMAAQKTDILVSYRWNSERLTRVLVADRNIRISRIRALQERGSVNADISPELISQIYEGIRDNVLGTWLLTPDSHLDVLKTNMRQAMKVFVNGIRK